MFPVGDEGQRLMNREMFVTLAPGSLDLDALGSLAPTNYTSDPKLAAKTVSLRSTVIELDMIVSDKAPTRKTKIAVTIGPSSKSPEVLEQLVDGGIDLARFKFSHGTPDSNAEILSNLRKVGKHISASIAVQSTACKSDAKLAWVVDDLPILDGTEIHWD